MRASTPQTSAKPIKPTAECGVTEREETSTGEQQRK
jgi:hypothetical protein